MTKICWDYAELLGRIVTKFGTQQRFAEALGISPAALSQRLNNVLDFSQAEIKTAMGLLDIKWEDCSLYFFTPKVWKS